MAVRITTTTRRLAKKEPVLPSEEWMVRLAPLRGLLDHLGTKFIVMVTLPSGQHVSVRGGLNLLSYSCKKFFTKVFSRSMYKKIFEDTGAKYLSDIFRLTPLVLKMGYGFNAKMQSVGHGSSLPFSDDISIGDFIGLEDIESFIERNWRLTYLSRVQKIDNLEDKIDDPNTSPIARRNRQKWLDANLKRLDSVPSVVLKFSVETNLPSNVRIFTSVSQSGVEQYDNLPFFAVNAYDAVKGVQRLFKHDKSLLHSSAYVRDVHDAAGQMSYVYSVRGNQPFNAKVEFVYNLDNMREAHLVPEGQILADVIRLKKGTELVDDRIVNTEQCIGCAEEMEFEDESDNEESRSDDISMMD